jgi:hypothetical protein
MPIARPPEACSNSASSVMVASSASTVGSSTGASPSMLVPPSDGGDLYSMVNVASASRKSPIAELGPIFTSARATDAREARATWFETASASRH